MPRDSDGRSRRRRRLPDAGLRGALAKLLDGRTAAARVKDLAGFYRKSFGRKYFKGPQRPRLADLSDTELVIYGP
jgi:hypothetical protein